MAVCCVCWQLTLTHTVNHVCQCHIPQGLRRPMREEQDYVDGSDGGVWPNCVLGVRIYAGKIATNIRSDEAILCHDLIYCDLLSTYSTFSPSKGELVPGKHT